MELQLITPSPFFDLLIRLSLDISVTWLLVIGFYSRYCKKRSLVFCLFIFNLIMFIMGFILSNAEVGYGAGLGLFVLISMLRFRSETLNFREMTYMFILITIGLLDSFRGIDSLGILVFLNAFVLVLIYFIEKLMGGKVLATEKVKYNNLEMLKPQFRNLLMQDIFLKTGVKPKLIEIDTINLTDETASITIYFDENENNGHQENPVGFVENLFSFSRRMDKKNNKSASINDPVLRVSN